TPGGSPARPGTPPPSPGSRRYSKISFPYSFITTRFRPPSHSAYLIFPESKNQKITMELMRIIQ
ncbi:hypothetical protein OFN53_24225, partial [Escherichia coli]|nr:hypothetical protein [Escherichia coli]